MSYPNTDHLPYQNQPEDFQAKAKRLVMDRIDQYYVSQGSSVPAYEVYVVWFSKTLQNWKALVSTTLQDNMYYEVTYNGDQRESYVDSYVKVDNFVVED